MPVYACCSMCAVLRYVHVVGCMVYMLIGMQCDDDMCGMLCIVYGMACVVYDVRCVS